MIVTLHGSPAYRFVTVGDFGIVRSYSPRTVVGDVQTVVYVSLRVRNKIVQTAVCRSATTTPPKMSSWVAYSLHRVYSFNEVSKSAFLFQSCRQNRAK